MKFFRNFVFWFVVMLVTINLLLASYSFYTTQGNANKVTASPIPNIFMNTFLKTSSIWEPNFTPHASAQQNLNLTSVSAISYDTATDKIIFEKMADKRLPMASLTKIMTAIIALENLNLTDQVTVTKSAASIGEGTMGLTYGERLTVEELLYGLLLQSGNDAGETLAQTSKFGRDRFLHLMNKKAEDMGLTNTRFTNPTGLEGDGLQYSTVKDLVILTNYAMKNPKFAQIVGTFEHIIPQTLDHKEFHLFNETNLLTTYPGVKGVKTGYTFEAGYCLVTFLDYENHKIIAVILNSQDRRQEMKDLLDYSLTSLGTKPPEYKPRL